MSRMCFACEGLVKITISRQVAEVLINHRLRHIGYVDKTLPLEAKEEIEKLKRHNMPEV
jgi:hypothetical protein